MNKFLLTVASFGFALFASAEAQAALNVFACEPEWGALAKVIGDNDVDVFTATTALQDPHQIQARPALISRLRNADLLVCTGAELEIGWLPVLLRQASNGKVQPGQPGYFEATSVINLLEKPSRLDRAEGDIHPAGNPHIQTDPRNMRVVAAALAKKLAGLDSAHAAGYQQREQAFDQTLGAAMTRLQAQAAPLKGVAFVSYHKSWVYLAGWLNMTEAANIEPKPGVPPGSAYIAELLDKIPSLKTRMIVYAAYEDPKPSQFVAEKSHLPAVMLPFTVGGDDAAKDIIGFYQDTVNRLLAGLGGKGG
ncbi:MAG TPA: zinc ABC transporter substrate-binding protein [Stellaceae bacterium]|jgi:zinc/manganese transport system substrate-binding protein|nr:zinc ABC transporter substrate-binding protein [Stellaceae bacterium]